MIKSLLKNLLFDPLKYSYYVGFLTQEQLTLPTKQRYSCVKWIHTGKYEKEGWFADPFLLSVTDTEITLLVEQMIYKTGRGILVKLVVNRKDMTITEKTNILSLPTHLSFPIYLRDNGKIYLYPENYQSNALKIYEYDEATDKLTFIKNLINAPLVDTQIVKIDDTYFAFAVKITDGTQSNTKDLYVYKSDSLLEDYTHIQTIHNNLCEERGAGMIFTDELGRLIRPAQCCEGVYGKEVILYHLQFDGCQFTETEINRIQPDLDAPLSGKLHTFNQMKGICTIDGYKWHYPYIMPIYKMLRGIKE